MSQRKHAANQGQHFVFVNGFPRKVDGLSLWEGAAITKPALALVLEAPDDVLTARVEERGRRDDHEESFIDRLSFYRQATQPVVAALHEAGMARYIDAACDATLVELAAAHVLQPSVVCVEGNGAFCKVLCDRVAEELPACTQIEISKLDRRGTLRPLEILRQRLHEPDCMSRLVLVQGSTSKLGEWLSQPGLPQPTLLLQLDLSDPSDAAQSDGVFLRRFQDVHEKSMATMLQLIRSCQPLSVPAAHSAIILLHRWMSVAPHLQWWDPDLFRKLEGHYVNYMKLQGYLK